MIYYLMISTSVCLFSLQFLFNSKYAEENGNTWNASIKFSLYASLSGFIALAVINKFNFDISFFSVIVACVYSVVCISLGYVSIKSFEYANLSIYSVFAMIGGMILPFIYGIICGEEFKLIRVVCCVLIAFCVSLSNNKQGGQKQAIKYYIAVFILNGMVGIISKFHQSCLELCVDSGSFMMLTKIFTVIFCFILLLLQKERKFFVSKKSALYTVVYSVVNSVGNLLLLIALLHVPASVQYPIVTGGTIVVSTIISLIKGDKILRKEIYAVVIAFAATLFMAF